VARKRSRPRVVLDAVIRGCLRSIQKGQLDALLVLADYLDETEHSMARRVRSLVTRWQAYVESWVRADFSTRRRVRPRWQRIGQNHAWVRREVLELFGLKVTGLGVLGRHWDHWRELYRANRGLHPVVPEEQGEDNE